MIIRISLSVKFNIHHFAILFNPIVSLETVLIPMIDYTISIFIKTYMIMTM